MTSEGHLAEQAQALLKAINSPWEAGIDGNLRSFVARYVRDGVQHHAVVLQSRGAYGYQAGFVTYGRREQTASLGLSYIGVCVWLGLDDVEEVLDWHIEL